MRKILLVFIFLQLITTINANDRFISGLFVHPVSRYFDMDMEANNDEWDTEEEFIEDIYEIVSGIIYGWDFYYEPSDIRREIEEIFEVNPIAQIKRDDPNMHLKDNWVEDYIMYQNIVYYLSDFQRVRLKSWKTTHIPTSSGAGEGSSYTETGKDEALREALKDSIKREFQSRGKDKPQSITGQILLKETPRLFINAGLFHYQVDVYILYRDIDEFKFH